MTVFIFDEVEGTISDLSNNMTLRETDLFGSDSGDAGSCAKSRALLIGFSEGTAGLNSL